MSPKITLAFSEDELRFLDWAMRFLEGGPFDAEREKQRDQTAFRVRKAFSDYGLDQPPERPGGALLWELIHPAITEVSRGRFEAGHYADAAEAALKEINTTVKEMVKSDIDDELDGARLMNRAFSPSNPIIRFDNLATESGKSIQQGYMQIFAGSMIGIRNPKAHANLEIDRSRAIHFLYLASLLMFKLDEHT